MRWTDLPGPSAFIETVEDDLRKSRTVLATVPECFNSEWLPQLKARLGNEFSVSEIPNSLQDFLQTYSNREDGQPLIQARELHENEVRGHVFILQQPPKNEWSSWLKFLLKFAQVNRTYSELERNVFLIIDAGDLELLPYEFLLSNRQIEPFLGSDDALLYSASLTSRPNRYSLEAQMIIHLRAEISLWDFNLCRYLEDYTVNELLKPKEILCAYEQDQGWENYSVASDTVQLSKKGLQIEFCGRRLAHSVLLCKDEDCKSMFNSRLWTAQVRSLFPFLEEQRHLILEKARHLDKNSVEAFERELKSEETMELSKLVSLMQRGMLFPSRLRQFAIKLNRIRNSIAHLNLCEIHMLPNEREIEEIRKMSELTKR